jgi:ATP-dependent RNA helicase DDX55/SPB4
VATPGQLQEMLHQKRCHLAHSVRSLEVLVLDEADRLLDMGFSESLNDILSYFPKQRRTGLFSATQTRQLEDLVRAGLRNPLFVKVKEKSSSSSQQCTPSQLQNYYAIVQPEKKVTCLVEFLRSHKKDKVMVFFATCAGVDYLFSLLHNLVRGANILALHGKMKGKRQTVFKNFSKMDSGILLCTDVMARGVDFPSVDWVVQFDPPSTSSVFVHRCGRTARIGHLGRALLFLLENEESFVEFLRIHQQVSLEPWTGEWELESVVPKIRKMAVKDRDVYEKGNNAFVAFIQSYGKNECNLIFQLKELHVGGLAEGMGLLRLPRMSELKGKDLAGFTHSDIDLKEIKYSDKHREKQHQLSLLAKKRKAEKAAMAQTKDNKWRKDTSVKKTSRSRKRQPNELSKKDLEELSEGARLLKKFKRGKITKKEFDEKLEKL